MTENEIRTDECKRIIRWIAEYQSDCMRRAHDAPDDQAVTRLAVGAAFMGEIMAVISAGLHNIYPPHIPRRIGDVVQ